MAYCIPSFHSHHFSFSFSQCLLKQFLEALSLFSSDNQTISDFCFYFYSFQYCLPVLCFAGSLPNQTISNPLFSGYFFRSSQVVHFEDIESSFHFRTNSPHLTAVIQPIVF